mmetsp:Transcript_11659/g.26711  ORF Transcript_11659/g.26711 Transcript_11659/m.26711 type:complete len:233 (+) Transcript_11659:377-1075(+)
MGVAASLRGEDSIHPPKPDQGPAIDNQKCSGRVKLSSSLLNEESGSNKNDEMFPVTSEDSLDATGSASEGEEILSRPQTRNSRTSTQLVQVTELRPPHNTTRRMQESSTGRQRVWQEDRSGRQGEWQDSVLQMELEANEELVQSFRQRMEEAEKSKAELETELEKAKHANDDTLQSLKSRIDQQEHENHVLRENALRLHKELDLIRSTFMDKQRENDDEVNRLRNELRLARR